MEYGKTLLRDAITIRRIVSIHYFEYARDYVYVGERHNFWEFLYVDKGKVEVMADTKGYCLLEGDIIFHKPDEFHNVWANGRVAPNLVVMSFECRSPAVKFFEDKILRLGDPERDLLVRILQEARSAFLTPLNVTELYQMEPNPEAPFGAGQIIRQSLEQLLILLMRRGSGETAPARMTSSVKERSDNRLVSEAVRFLEDNAQRKITFAEVCGHTLQSGSTLKTLFRRHMGCGVMTYANRLKIDVAKRMIRESGLNFSDISETMGYSSVHYFSRQFKKATDMTPSQYARSAMSRL
jgi:AraC-like DNA-binding protein